MITKKSINAALPRLDELRRSFLLPGSTGWIPYPHMSHLSCAMLDIDPDTGDATRCVVYGVGDAMEHDHYYGIDCVDITSQIIEWMSNEYVDRKVCVGLIQDAVIESQTMGGDENGD